MKTRSYATAIAASLVLFNSTESEAALGPAMLADLAPNNHPPTYSADFLRHQPRAVQFGDYWIFAMYTPVKGYELWKYDTRTDQLQIVADHVLGPSSPEPRAVQPRMHRHAEHLIYDFEAYDCSEYCAERGLWTMSLDGKVRQIAKTEVYGALTVVDDKVIFSSRYLDYDEETSNVWSYDLSARTLHRLGPNIAALHTSSLDTLAVIEDQVLLRTNDGIWASDGTTENTTYVAPGNHIRLLGMLGERAIVRYDDGTHGSELFTYDPATRSLTLLRDIAVGAEPSEPTKSGGVFADCLFFQATTPETGTELWCTDGTPSGTRLIHESIAGPASDLMLVWTFGDVLIIYSRADRRMFYLHQDLESTSTALPNVDAIQSHYVSSRDSLVIERVLADEVSLWELDGSQGGAWRLTPWLQPNHISGVIGENANGYYVTRGSDSVGYEIWTTGITPADFEQVEDIYPGPTSSAARCVGMREDGAICIASPSSENRAIYRLAPDGAINQVTGVGISNLRSGSPEHIAKLGTCTSPPKMNTALSHGI